jgi:hypothetical protein
MASVKETIGSSNYEQVRTLLQKCFPGTPSVDDATVDGFTRALYKKQPAAALKAGFPPPQAALAAPEEAARASGSGTPAYPLYVAQATHHRVRSMTSATLGSNSNVPFESEFVGYLPMVRVPLPAVLPPGDNFGFTTQIGQVYLSSDHLVGSVQLVAQKYADQLGYTPGRVDLITPARTGVTRSRFGAIAAYLGYKNYGDTQPSFYLLEAGMATGQAMMLYFGRTMSSMIEQRSGYVPTAYSSDQNFYKGHLVVQNNEPISLTVQAIPPQSQAYIQVSVAYQPITSIDNDPFTLLLDAAARVALVGNRMGAPSGIPLGDVLADYAANELPWVVQPNYGGPGTVSPPALPGQS